MSQIIPNIQASLFVYNVPMALKIRCCQLVWPQILTTVSNNGPLFSIGKKLLQHLSLFVIVGSYCSNNAQFLTGLRTHAQYVTTGARGVCYVCLHCSVTSECCHTVLRKLVWPARRHIFISFRCALDSLRDIILKLRENKNLCL